MTQIMQPKTQTVNRELPGLLDRAIDETIQQRHQTISERAARRMGIPPSKLLEMMRNIWKVSNGQPPLTDHELFVGLSLVAKYDLDPTCREIYVTRGKDGKLMVVVGIDGWVKILDRTKHYDGHEQDVHFDENGNLEWVETRIYSTKRSRPSVYRAYWKEYQAVGGYMKEKLPIHMLRLFSLHHATRMFTPIGGHVRDESESFMAAGYSETPAIPSTSKAEEMAARLRARQNASVPPVEQTIEPELYNAAEATPERQEPSGQQSEQAANHSEAPKSSGRELTPEDITEDFDRCGKMSELTALSRKLEAEADGAPEKIQYIRAEFDRRSLELQARKGK